MEEDFGKLVSAVIVTHNRAELLPRAVESVRNQTYENLEIIIVDDGSQDHTEEVVRAFQQKDSRIRALRLEPSQGACAARNCGIREAAGEFVAGLDDDDEWHPRRVEILLRNFQKEYAYVFSRSVVVYTDRVECRRKQAVVTYKDMLFENLTGNQVFTERERILAVGGFDTTLSAGQDYDLWLRLLKRYGKAKLVDEPLQTVYKDHLGERIGRSSKKKFRGDWKVYRKCKSDMNSKQRVVRLIFLRKLKGKNIPYKFVIGCHGTRYFFPTLMEYIKQKLKFKFPLLLRLLKGGSVEKNGKVKPW